MAKMMVMVFVALIMVVLSTSCWAQLYYMPYNAPIPYGPYMSQAQFGYGWRPVSLYERDMYYQRRYFNRTYYYTGRGQVRRVSLLP